MPHLLESMDLALAEHELEEISRLARLAARGLGALMRGEADDDDDEAAGACAGGGGGGGAGGGEGYAPINFELMLPIIKGEIKRLYGSFEAYFRAASGEYF